MVASLTRSRASGGWIGRHHAVSVSISEALVETALGLVVAIPAVWFYSYLPAMKSSAWRWTTLVGTRRLLRKEDGQKMVLG